MTSAGNVNSSKRRVCIGRVLSFFQGRRSWPHLPKVYDFKNGKLWPNDRPGLGVDVDVSKLNKIGEYTTYRAGMLLNHRPDGSFTNW